MPRLFIAAATACCTALLAAAPAFAGDIERYDGGWADIADDTPVTFTSTGSVTLSAGSVSITCGGETISGELDHDGSIDSGQLSSVAYTGCTMATSPFGVSMGPATVTACNLASTDVAINGSSIAVRDWCFYVSAACGTFRVEGDISGSFTNPTNTPPTNGSTASFSGAPGLHVTAQSGFCASVGNAAAFSGTFRARTADGSYMRSL